MVLLRLSVTIRNFSEGLLEGDTLLLFFTYALNHKIVFIINPYTLPAKSVAYKVFSETATEENIGTPVLCFHNSFPSVRLKA